MPTVEQMINAARLNDPAERLMLADALEDAGRDGEAALLRQGETVLLAGTFVEGTPINRIRAAHALASGAWTGLDWPLMIGDDQHDIDGMSAAACLAQRDGWNTVAGLDLSEIDRLEDAEASAEQCREAIADELGLIPLGVREDESYRDACYRWAAEWQAGADAISNIEESADYAEECGANALAFAEVGDLEAAYRAAEAACRAEAQYGDCPVWHALRVAIRDEMENDADDE